MALAVAIALEAALDIVDILVTGRGQGTGSSSGADARAAEHEDRRVLRQADLLELLNELTIHLHGRIDLPGQPQQALDRRNADIEPFRFGAHIDQHRLVIAGQNLERFGGGYISLVHGILSFVLYNERLTRLQPEARPEIRLSPREHCRL